MEDRRFSPEDLEVVSEEELDSKNLKEEPEVSCVFFFPSDFTRHWTEPGPRTQRWEQDKISRVGACVKAGAALTKHSDHGCQDMSNLTGDQGRLPPSDDRPSPQLDSKAEVKEQMRLQVRPCVS